MSYPEQVKAASAGSVLAAASVMIALTLASGARAAEQDGWTASIYGGIKAGGLVTDFDADQLRSTLQASGLTTLTEVSKQGDNFGYGAWLGYALSEHWGLEISYTGGADERVLLQGLVPSVQAALDAGKPDMIGYGESYLASLRYQKELSPEWFISPRAGLGMTRTRQTFTSLNSGQSASFEDESFSYNIGAGLHYVLAPDWSVGLIGDYHQVPGEGMYAMISLALEWHVPSAFRPRTTSATAVQVPAASSVPTTPAAAAVATSAAPERIELKGVNFETASDQLTPASLAILDEMAVILQGRMQASPGMQVEVSGHTDSRGDEARNVRLSQARAQSVADYLASRKVDPARLRVVGRGSSKPVASNETAEGRGKNRRVELEIRQ